MLRQAITTNEKIAAIGIARHEATKDPRAWNTRFNEYVPFALTFCKDAQHVLRLQALQWISSFVLNDNFRHCCMPVLDSLLLVVSDTLDDSFSEVRSEAALTLRSILHSSLYTAVECSVAALRALTRNQSSSAPSRGWLYLLEALGTLAERTPPSTKLEHSNYDPRWSEEIVAICQFLVPTFVHELSEVRKTVVGVFVKYLFAFEPLTIVPLLKPLVLSQLKLLSIYYNRSASDRGFSGVLVQRDIAKELESMGHRAS